MYKFVSHFKSFLLSPTSTAQTLFFSERKVGLNYGVSTRICPHPHTCVFRLQSHGLCLSGLCSAWQITETDKVTEHVFRTSALLEILFTHIYEHDRSQRPVYTSPFSWTPPHYQLSLQRLFCPMSKEGYSNDAV